VRRGCFPVLRDRCFFPVEACVSAESAGHVVAAQGAGGASGGERFGVLPRLLRTCLSVVAGHWRGGGEQPWVGGDEGGVDVGSVAADGVTGRGPVDRTGGVEVPRPRGGDIPGGVGGEPPR